MLRFPRRTQVLLVCWAAGMGCVGCAPPESKREPAAAAEPATTDAPVEDRKLLTGTRLYPSPEAPPIDFAWVYVEGGTIKAVGAKSSPPPADATPMAACSGGVITAGFQNSHVHFTHDSFADAATRPAEALSVAFERMLTGFGYTTVVDTGSNPANTFPLRERIERGEIRGPRILTVGTPLYPKDGIPFYLRDLPPELLSKLPQPGEAAQATQLVRANLESGADGTKLFIATPQADGSIKYMAPEIARAAAEESHARGKLVMAHPTDTAGMNAILDSKVDIAVHTTIGRNSAWSPELIRKLVAARVSVIPTLKLWGYELEKGKVPAEVQPRIVGGALQEVKAFSEAGGQILFGTDVGYMSEIDPTEEYELMSQAGLTPMQILASLTTAPAARWNESEKRGAVRAGMSADLVVLNGDPATDAKQFANVKCTIRGGRELFVRKP
jgi:imidazolonepropionase-like amidohydrolase